MFVCYSLLCYWISVMFTLIADSCHYIFVTVCCVTKPLLCFSTLTDGCPYISVTICPVTDHLWCLNWLTDGCHQHVRHIMFCWRTSVIVILVDRILSFYIRCTLFCHDPLWCYPSFIHSCQACYIVFYFKSCVVLFTAEIYLRVTNLSDALYTFPGIRALLPVIVISTAVKI